MRARRDLSRKKAAVGGQKRKTPGKDVTPRSPWTRPREARTADGKGAEPTGSPVAGVKLEGPVAHAVGGGLHDATRGARAVLSQLGKGSAPGSGTPLAGQVAAAPRTNQPAAVGELVPTQRPAARPVPPLGTVRAQADADDPARRLTTAVETEVDRIASSLAEDGQWKKDLSETNRFRYTVWMLPEQAGSPLRSLEGLRVHFVRTPEGKRFTLLDLEHQAKSTTLINSSIRPFFLGLRLADNPATRPFGNLPHQSSELEHAALEGLARLINAWNADEPAQLKTSPDERPEVARGPAPQ